MFIVLQHNIIFIGHINEIWYHCHLDNGKENNNKTMDMLANRVKVEYRPYLIKVY